MLLTCRSTVRSLIARALGDRPVRQPGRRRAAGPRPRARSGRRDAAAAPVDRVDSAGEVRRRAEPLEHLAGGRRSRVRRRRRRRARGRRGRSRPGPAPPRTARRAPATAPTRLRSTASAPATSPSASRTVPSGPGRHRAQERRIDDRPASRAELVGGVAGRVDVAGGERDLDERLQQPRPGQLVGRLVDRSPDRRGRRSPTSPCARRSSASPGSGRRPQRAGLAVAGLGRLELAAQPVAARPAGRYASPTAGSGGGRDSHSRARRPRRSPRATRRGSASARRG